MGLQGEPGIAGYEVRLPFCKTLNKPVLVICIWDYNFPLHNFLCLCLQGHQGSQGPMGAPGPKGEKVHLLYFTCNTELLMSVPSLYPMATLD